MSSISQFFENLSSEFNPNQNKEIVEKIHEERDIVEMKKIVNEHYGDSDILELFSKRIEELLPDHIGSIIDLGWAYWFQNERDKGLPCLERSRVALENELVRYLSLLAAYEEDSDERISLYKKILEIDPENKPAKHNIKGEKGDKFKFPGE